MGVKKLKFFLKEFLLRHLLSKTEKEALRYINFGYLHETGWWKSWTLDKPTTLNEEPIPWITFSAIEFIETNLNKQMVVFEYGSGNSTFYYSKRVKKLVSVEHDFNWYTKLNKTLPKNVQLIFKELEYGGEYSKSALDTELKYDLIIVDGRDRVNCVYQSIRALNDKGVILFDDSERKQYSEGIQFLIDNGFKSIDFWGLAPGVINKKCTSIFYRIDNVCNI